MSRESPLEVGFIYLISANITVAEEGAEEQGVGGRGVERLEE